jgi:hypothetical protein
MRTTIPFDTHAHVKRTIAAGMPEAQAEVQAEALAEIALANLATEDDLRQAVDAVEQRVEARLATLELRFPVHVGAMLAASIAFIVALQKLL